MNNSITKFTFLLSCYFVISMSFRPVHAQNLDTNIELLKTEYVQARTLLPNQVDSAIRIFEKLNSKAIQLKNDEYIAKTLYMLGVSYYYNSQFYVSQNYYQKAIESTYTRNNALLREYVRNNMGINYDKTGDIVNALKAYQESLELAEIRGDSISMAQTWLNIALLHDQQNQTGKAIDLTLNALNYFTIGADSLDIALSYQNLDKYYHRIGKVELSDSCSFKALHLFEQLDNQYSVVKVTFNIASKYTERGWLDKSEKLFNSTLTKSQELDIPDFVSKSYISLADINIAKKNYPKAKILLDSAKQINARYQLTHNLETYYLPLLRLHVKKGDFDAYEKTNIEYEAYIEKKFSDKTAGLFQEMMVLYENEKIVATNTKLESDINIRNNQLFYVSIILLVSILALIIIGVQYKRIQNQMRVLYRKTIEMSKVSPASKLDKNTVFDKAVIETNTVDPELLNETEDYSRFGELFDKIKNLMEVDMAFLNKRLTIHDISTELATNSKYISMAINNATGNSFTYFVNQYRINKAVELVTSQKSKSSSNFDEIAELSGFNSRSSFNRQFSEFTGLSPSQFMNIRNEHVSNS